MHIIFALGAFQSLVFSILLLLRKGSKQSDYFLSGFFFVIALYMLNTYSVKFGLWQQYPNIFIIHILITLLYGPLLYFYVSSLIGNRINKRQIFAHLLPILGILALNLPFLFHSESEKMMYFTDKFINLPLNISIGTFLQHLSPPIYFAWILVILNKHKHNIMDNFSSIEEINLNWMSKLLIGGISIWLLDTLNVYALNFTSLEFPATYNLSWYIKAIFVLFIMLIGYYGINQGSIFSKNKDDENEEIQNDEPLDSDEQCKKDEDDCYNKAKLISDEKSKKYAAKLTEYFNNEKAYLNNELRIQDVSISLNIPVHILSHLINTELNKNFYDFVNTYRINEVKKRLRNPEYNQLTFIAIAYDCGFNSKATFNRLFKQYTGVTPSQFKGNNSIKEN